MCSCSSKRGQLGPPTRMERMTFWDGQTLKSADLNGFSTIADARRWWHNRALHNAYGISFGLEVTPLFLIPGATSVVPAVHVRAGIAYDRFGRMLYQPYDLDVPYPSDASGLSSAIVLLLRWPELSAQGCCCSPPAKCCVGEPVHRGDGVELYWKDARRIQVQDGIPIARGIPSKDPKNPGVPLDKTFLAPRLRRFQRPHIVEDGTLPGATAWELGPADLVYPDPDTTFLSWQPVEVYIDTSAAGFSQTPTYFAVISGSLFDEARQLLLPVVFPHVVDEFPDRFTFRFWIPIYVDQPGIARINAAGGGAVSDPSNVIGFEAFRVFARRQKLRVVWVGCETPPPGVEINRGRLERKPCGCGVPAMPLSR